MNAYERFDFKSDWLPSIILGLFLLFTSVTNFFLPVFFAEQLNFTANQIGLLYSAQSLAGVLAAFPSGVGNDRVTSRSIVILSLMLMAAGYALMGVVKAFAVYIALYFVLMIAYNMFRLSIDVQMLKTDKGSNTSRRIALFQSWRFGGLLLGTILSGYLLTAVSFENSFFVVAGLCLFLIILAKGLIPTHISPVRLKDYLADFSDNRTRLFAIWMFLFALHWGAEFVCYGLFLRKEFSLSYVGMGWYMSAEFLTILVAVLLMRNYITDLRKMVTALMAGLVLSGVGHIGMVFSPLWVSVSFRALHGIGDGIMFMVFYIGLAKLFVPSRVGGSAGVMNLAGMVGTIVGAMISSNIGERWSYGIPLWASGIILILLAAPFAALRFIELAKRAPSHG